MSQSNNHNKDKQIVKGFLCVAIVEDIILRKNTFREQVQFKTQGQN